MTLVTYTCGTCGTPRQLKRRRGKVNLNKDCHSCALKKCNPVKWLTKHGDYKTRLYVVWCGMKQRCNYPKNIAYKWYGAKGIQVCSEWSDSFAAFRDWAHANGFKEGLEIDRIDSDKNYCPENCRWVTGREQSIKSVKQRMANKRAAA